MRLVLDLSSCQASDQFGAVQDVVQNFVAALLQHGSESAATADATTAATPVASAALSKARRHEVYVAVNARLTESAEQLRTCFLSQLLPGHFISWICPENVGGDLQQTGKIAALLRDMALQNLLADVVLHVDSSPVTMMPGFASPQLPACILRIKPDQIAAMTADPAMAWQWLDAALSSYRAARKFVPRVALVCNAESAQQRRIALQQALGPESVVDLFVENGTQDATGFPHGELARRRAFYSTVVYHLDNEAGSAFMLPLMEQCPGVLVLAPTGSQTHLDKPFAQLAARMHAPKLVRREELYGDGMQGVTCADAQLSTLSRRLVELSNYLIASPAMLIALQTRLCSGAWLPPIDIISDSNDAALATACVKAIELTGSAGADDAIARLASTLTTIEAGDDAIDTIAFHAASNANLRRQPRLLVDVSQLSQTDARTGIQRVVRNIARELGRCLDLDRPFELVRLSQKRLWRASGVAASIFELSEDAFPEQEIFIQPGDTLLMLDSSWEPYHDFDTTFQAIRQMGGKIVTVVYDVIPLLLPDLCSPGLTAIFENWFAQALVQSDLLLCISAAVADEVRGLQQQRGNAKPAAVSHWRLGADISVRDDQTPVRQQVRDIVADRDSPLFLMVGTIEPRKGHDFALDAFGQLWQENSHVRLCIAGSIGWMVADTVQRIRQHPQLNKKLFFIEQFTDAEIELCYRSASALIAASVAEGFGLPIVEAALHQVPVIASDIAVFREVGGPDAVFFARSDPHHLADALRDFLARPRRMDQASGLPHVTWRQSTVLLLDAIGCRRG